MQISGLIDRHMDGAHGCKFLAKANRSVTLDIVFRNLSFYRSK